MNSLGNFIFKNYHFNVDTKTAVFEYEFEGGLHFCEKIEFSQVTLYDSELLDRALFLAFIIIGVSYYKTFPSRKITIRQGSIDSWQANFFNSVYQQGLSQFAFENELTPRDLAHFEASEGEASKPILYQGTGILALQSGGKDSLLTASLLKEKGLGFTPWFVSSTHVSPAVLNTFDEPLEIATRHLDIQKLVEASRQGAKNGHVPVTYIVKSLALIQAILLGKGSILVSIGHEGEEPHEWIGDFPVNHQWSKTWPAEQSFVEYVHRYISPDIRIGSPLRQYSELHIAELFVTHSWRQYGKQFSSCNVANYRQGSNNSSLQWCGNCPKCANSFLLFAPFLPANELADIFDGQDLFTKPNLQQTFKGLLGIENVMKPFECVGETDELRLAYHMAIERGDYTPLSFDIPRSDFNYKYNYPSQTWARQMVQ